MDEVETIKDFKDYITYDSKNLYIDFNSIFDVKGLNELGTLTLKKRSYYTIAPLIADTIGNIFDNCQQNIVMPYLNTIAKIKDVDDAYSIDDFEFDLLNEIINNDVINAINHYIDSTYVGGMDEKTEQTKRYKKINVELQFTDEHVLILLKSAEAIRLSIPLITQYYISRPDDIVLNDLIYDMFLAIIRLFEGKINIFNKLHRFIYSRVVQTQYSDKTIWNLLSNKSKDVQVITMEFLQDIIITILPKSVMEKEIVNFFHVVVRKKTKFEFSRDYKMTFKPVNLNQADSDGLTQFDKWDITLSKKNEAKAILNRLAIKDELKNIKSKFKFNITPEEFAYYKENIVINSFQKQYLFLFYAKYVGSYEGLYSCEKNEYVYLLILMYKWLKFKGYKILQKYLIAVPDKLNEKRISNKTGKIFDKVINSKTYKQLLSTKYLFIDTNVIESNYIIKLIGNITVSKYLKLPDYYDFLAQSDKSKILQEEIDGKIEIIADDILNFLIEI